MKILTTNASGKAIFGGIHTLLREHIINSPEHTFHIVDLNKERKYIPKDNRVLYQLDLPLLINTDNILDVLNNSSSYENFNQRIEKVVNEFQNVIQTSSPDVIIMQGTSLSSYFLFKAARREEYLDRTIHSYAGVIEKEMGEYSGDSRYLLGIIGKRFTSKEALENITYVFPSELCKQTVEDLHGVKIENAHVVYNGVSDNFFDESVERIPPDQLSLGYIGRIHHVKNPRFFLDLKENIKEPVILKIITDLTSAANKTDGKSLLNKLTHGDVLYYSPRSPENLKDFYKTQLSATVVPSLFETFCNVALESITSGTPVLLSDRSGAREIFEKFSLDDLIFSIDNLDSFNTALKSARKRDFKISNELRHDIYSELSWKKTIEKYNAIAESIVH